jgi:hypothetical protein
VIAGFMWAPLNRPGAETANPTMTRPTTIDTAATLIRRSPADALGGMLPTAHWTRLKTMVMNAVVRQNSTTVARTSAAVGRMATGLAISMA